MGITILVENIRVDPILVENISDISESYKNVSGIKQARPRFPRHSYPTGKYLAIIKICPARAILLRYKRLMTSSQ